MKIFGGIQFNLNYSDNIEIKNILSKNSDWTVIYTEEERLVTAYTGMDGHRNTVFATITYKVKNSNNEKEDIQLKNVTVTNTKGETKAISENETEIQEETGSNLLIKIFLLMIILLSIAGGIFLVKIKNKRQK